ncbi:hypothetical protein [Pseudomonas putida]|uniref:hypothetical protein n=1 Tax=Pseudomonas putida TaxID=303 RepID=UPI0023648064|nr:hypothetical protein [Pseudomonas putida]MDD1988156.1 hypothetical protein [Pseudomonas putida]HDS1793003.1 hypothetical protein [Pseudomonas putida]
MNGRLYRYSSQKYNSMLLNEGATRIGTLYDFRRSEHKVGIADPSEGKKTVFHHVDDWAINDEVDGSPSKTMRAMSEVGMFDFGPGGGQRMTGITLARRIHSPDYFIHCSAYKLSDSVLKQFEGADSCVEITNPYEFYRHVTEALNKITPARFQGIHVIKYTDREEEWNGQNYGTPGLLIKEIEFKDQCEVRAIWSAEDGVIIEPVVVRDMNITKLVRRIF